MDIIAAPDSVDVQSFQFKLHRRIKAFDSTGPDPSSSLNLVAVASRFGLLFVGSPNNNLHVFQVKTLVAEEGLQCPRRVFPLEDTPVNLSVNCSQDLLCIVVKNNNCLAANIYHTKSCINENLSLSQHIRLRPSPGVSLCRLLWNPCQADMLSICTSDGSVSVYQCKQSSLDVQTIAANARCLSWSPKGKQIVTGNADGSLSQYKPDLTPVKNFPAPKLFDNNQLEAIAIHWISTYQFSVVFKDSVDSDNRPCVTIVNTPKVGTPNCVNYEDICYSMGNIMPIHYYLTHLPSWGILFASSANSMEVGVLGTADQNNWEQWIQMDEARAELPLTEDKQENYPIGFAFDDAAIYQLPWGENEVLPHMPMIHILSHTGVLVSFYAINLTQGSIPICNPPEELNIPHHLMITDIPSKHGHDTLKTVAETSTQQLPDISFVMPQNIITSTPTIPKAASPFNIGGVNKPATNLFGITKEQMAQDAPKPAVEIFSKPFTAETKAQESAAFKPPPAAPIAVQQPQAIATPKPVSVPNKPTVQPEKYSEPQQQVENQINQSNKGSINQLDDKQTKSYEAILKTTSNETIKAMLLKEMNEFQTELYELLKKCKSVNTQVGTPSEMKEIISALEQYDREPPEKMYSNQDVKHQISALNQCLIKMCSVLVKAQMQPEALEQLGQLDPVSSEKLASIKQSMYYIESQIKQVNNVLDEQWETFQGDCKKRITAFKGLGNDGDIMKMPTLDKVYQPLVRQHDILIRQQGTIKTLLKLAESLRPQILSTKIGQPLTKGLKDSQPLSTLTKNLLNLNIQPNDILDAKYRDVSERDAKYTLKKQNALRELLANHHTVRIKPTKVEPSNRLQSFLERNPLSSFQVQQSAKDNDTIPATKPLSSEPVKSIVSESNTGKMSALNSKMMEAILRPTPQFPDNQPLSNLNKFVSNMVGDNDKSQKPVSNANATPPSAPIPASKSNEQQNKSAQQNIKSTATQNINPSIAPAAANNSAKITTFMGQPICSPTPRSTPNSVFGSNPSQIAFGSSSNGFGDMKNVISSLPKSTTATPSSTESVFKSLSFAPQAVATESSIFSSPKPQTKPTPVDSQNVVKSPLSSIESQASTITFGSLSISKVPSPPLGTVTTSSIPPGTNTKTIFGAVPSQVSSITPSTTSSMSASNIFKAPTLSSSPNVSVTVPPSNTATTDDAKPLFSGSNTTISFGTQIKPSTTSVFGTPSSTSPLEVFGGTSVSTSAATIASTDSSTLISQTSPDTAVVSTAASTFSLPAPTTSTSAFTAASTASVFSTASTTTSVFGTASTTTSVFGTASTTTSLFTPASTPSVFGGVSSPATSVFSVSSTTTTPSSIFGAVSTPSTVAPPFGAPSANSLFASANANINSTGSMFDSLTVTTTSGQSSLFGSPVTTCAASLFGAANASVPSTVTSMFGSSSISTTSSPFGSPTNTGGSMFGGGSTFGAPSAFGQSGSSVFGGGNSAFGQPQSNVFGGVSKFGGFGSTSPPASNVFGQSPSQPGNMFGSPPSPTNPGNLFGGGGSLFGSPATAAGSPQGASIFGSPSGQSSVFGGAATFGAKPVFGQSTSFGSSPTGGGGFGSFTGTGDQQNVATAGFGSPSAFSKPPGTFGGSPTFGSTGGFGATPSFPSSFDSPVKSFGSPGTESAFGNSQSSTFENLAVQSTITFGNLAQQSPPAQQAAPAFQGNPSFSMWR